MKHKLRSLLNMLFVAGTLAGGMILLYFIMLGLSLLN